MRDSILWKKGRYLIPIVIPFLTHFLVEYIDGDNEYLNEDELMLYWSSGIILTLIGCIIFSKPYNKYSNYLIGLLLITLSPYFLMVVDLVDTDIYNKSTGIGNIITLFGILGTLFTYSLRFYEKPQKSKTSIFKMGLIFFISLSSIALLIFIFGQNQPVIDFLSPTTITSIVLLPVIHAIDMLQWENEKEDWQEKLAAAAIPNNQFSEELKSQLR